MTGSCSFCGAEAALKCSGCSKDGVSTFYCSAEHQKKHWKTHKRQCGVAPTQAAEADAGAEAEEEAPPSFSSGSGIGEKASKGPCAVCGVETRECCSNCRRYDVYVFFCSEEHMEEGWDAHKLKCGAKAVTKGGGGKTCARCMKACDGSMCRVSHPVHKRTDMGGSFGPNGSTWMFHCGACGQNFQITNPDRSGKMEDGRIASGPKWCFEGKHSDEMLAEKDERRVYTNTKTLTEGQDLQAEIDALPEDVRTLTIRSSGCYGGFERRYTISKHLPFLDTLILNDVGFDKIELTHELTPQLRSLKMQNIHDDCALTLRCPKLRDFSLHYFSGDGAAIDELLRTATRLKTFDSYKLWSNRALTFASNKLESIDLHRADSLESVTIWAPSLSSLRLQACYSIENLKFLKTHALAESLARNHVPPRELEVNITNANLSSSAMRALEKHPRAVVHGRDMDLGFGGGFGGMEAMFRQMQNGGGFGAGGFPGF